MESAFSDPDGLIENNLGFVVHIATRYRSLGIPMEDLISEGRLGQVEAARRFIPGRNSSFTTYASWWIRKSILAGISRDFSMVRVPEYHRKKLKATEREPKPESPPKWIRVQSLDSHREDRESPPMADKIQDRQPDAGARLLQDEDVHILQQALDNLSRRERDVLMHRYGLSGQKPPTLSELGRTLGLSKERVRQIEACGKQRIRRFINNRHKDYRRPRMIATAGT